MGVAKGVEEGGGWPYGHLAFQRCTGAEGGEYSRPLAAGVLAPRLTEAARASSGGRHEAAHPLSWLCDRRRREAAGRPCDRTAAGDAANPPHHHPENAAPGAHEPQRPLMSYSRPS